MNKMTEAELITALAPARANAETYSSELSTLNDCFEDAYYGRKTGDFEPLDEQSSAVSSDVFDTVESDMPPQARVFLGSGDIITFKPNSNKPADIEEAEEKTKYINWVVRNQPESFKMIFNVLKGAAIYKNAVLKYYVEDQKEIEMVEYKNVNIEEVQKISASLGRAEVDKVTVDIAEQEEIDEQTFNIRFRVTKESKKLVIVNIRRDHFRITDDAEDLETAQLVGDSSYITRGELIAEGYSKDVVNKLSTVSIGSVNSNNRDSNNNQGIEKSLINDWASEYVEDSDYYVKIDFDGDGIAERRRIRMSGETILENEYYNHVPYASFTAILMPNKAIGLSRAEIVYETQRQKTTLLRGMFTNMDMVNNPRNIVHPDVDLDDMLYMRTNGIIRMEDDTSILPQNAVFPLTTQYTGTESLQTMQYIDQARAQKTGDLLTNQGLDADSIAKETATRFAGVEKAGAAKGELIIRNYAETGFRKLFEGLAWTASRFQDSKTEILVLGKELTVNPTGWMYDHKIETKVGLGAGDNEGLIEARQAIYGIQQQLKAQGSTLVDEQGMYENLNGITQGLGFNASERLFNNPDEDSETLKAENEQLNAMVIQMQEQLKQMENPLVEMEQVKREGDIAIAQGNLSLKASELQEKQRQFNVKTENQVGLELANYQQSQQKLDSEAQAQSKQLALKLTELELQFNQQLDKEVADNVLVFDPAINDFSNAAR